MVRRSKEESKIPVGEDLLDRIKADTYDPLRILAMYASGDVVGLGLLSQERYEAEAEYDVDDNQITPSGRAIALEILPAKVRMDAAKELAQYIYGKKRSEEIVAKVAASGNDVIQFYIPENGRGEVG